MDNLKIVSLNVRGLRNAMKRKKLFKMFRENNYDILCLQECYVTEDVAATWKKEWGGGMIFSEGTNHGRGQIILIKKHFPFDWEAEVVSDRIVIIRFQSNGKLFAVFNIYAPSSLTETKDFFSSIQTLVTNDNSDRKIICGDYNAVLDNQLDIISGRKHSDALVESFNDLVDECELYDVWRIFNVNNKEYTWSKRSNSGFIARRLDYILVNNNVLSETILWIIRIC